MGQDLTNSEQGEITNSQRVASQFLSQQNLEVMLHVLVRGDL
jgi:hypothetical protein